MGSNLMKDNFWEKLDRPIWALAPMAGITDSAFRRICKEYGADVLYSEMASATALFYSPKETLELIEFSRKERPYVVQLFGSKPEHFAHAAKLLTNEKYFYKLYPLAGGPNSKFSIPDGIDINFGCPVPKVAKQGAGAELMKNLKLSREVIKSVIDNTDLPVSVKIRAKAGEVDALKFLDNIKDLDVKAIMIHGRTLAQGFSGSIDVEIIRKARDYFKGVILANGNNEKTENSLPRIWTDRGRQPAPNLDRPGIAEKCKRLSSAEYYRWLMKETRADGAGIARDALGKPWIFSELKSQKLTLPNRQAGLPTGRQEVESQEDVFKVMLKHAKLAEKLKGKQGIIEMRKHLCWYVQGLPGARRMREKLVKAENIKEIEEIIYSI